MATIMVSLDKLAQDDIREHITEEYRVKSKELEGIVFIARAWYSESYDEGEWYLVRMPDGELRENEAAHCSCYGFEGQWRPSHTSLKYLLSEHFRVPFSDYEVADCVGATEEIKVWAKSQAVDNFGIQE